MEKKPPLKGTRSSFPPLPPVGVPPLPPLPPVSLPVLRAARVATPPSGTRKVPRSPSTAQRLPE